MDDRVHNVMHRIQFKQIYSKYTFEKVGQKLESIFGVDFFGLLRLISKFAQIYSKKVDFDGVVSTG